MTRAAAFVLFLVGLVASGRTLVRNDFHLGRGGATHLPSSEEVAATELITAGSQMAAAKAAIGTFQYADLRHFQNLTVVSASERSFCLQVVKGGKLFHLRGPGGRPAEGGC